MVEDGYSRAKKRRDLECPAFEFAQESAVYQVTRKPPETLCSSKSLENVPS
jgi:hypothetical protein